MIEIFSSARHRKAQILQKAKCIHWAAIELTLNTNIVSYENKNVTEQTVDGL